MRKRVFKTFAAAALATTIAGTTIIGSTAFADRNQYTYTAEAG